MYSYLSIIVLLLISLCGNSLLAQISVDRQLIANAGNHFQSANLSLYFSLGETMIMPYDSGNLYLSQGFQQVGDENSNALQPFTDEATILLYPQPAEQSLTIQLKMTKNMLYKIEIFDILGRQIHTSGLLGPSPSFKQRLDIHSWPSGSYFLRILDDSGNIISKKKWIKR